MRLWMNIKNDNNSAFYIYYFSNIIFQLCCFMPYAMNAGLDRYLFSFLWKLITAEQLKCVDIGMPEIFLHPTSWNIFASDQCLS